MDLGEKIKTNEQIKQDILQYLEDRAAAKRGRKIQDFTLRSISKHVKVEEKKVEKLLTDLETDENIVETVKIDTKIYLTKEKRDEIAKKFEKAKLVMPMPSYLGFVIVIFVLIIAAPYILTNASITDVLFLAFIFGLILTLIFDKFFKEFVSWKARSEKSYKKVVRNLKFVSVIFIAIIVIYYAFIILSGSKMELTLFVGIIGIFLGLISLILFYNRK